MLMAECFFVAQSQIGDSCWAWYGYAYGQQLLAVRHFDMFLCAVLFAYMQLMLQKRRPLAAAGRTLSYIGTMLSTEERGVYVHRQNLEHDLDLLLIIHLCIES